MKNSGLRTYRSHAIHHLPKLRQTHTAEQVAAEIALMDRSETIAREWLALRGVKICRRVRNFAPWEILGARPSTATERRGWRDRSWSGWGSCETCDHMEWFMRDGVPAIIVAHNYMNTTSARALAEVHGFADFYGLRASISETPSWYYPGVATLVEYSAP